MADFTRELESRAIQQFTRYSDLHRWSVEHDREFWSFPLEYFSPILEGHLESGTSTFLNYQWFPKLQLNDAENLLRHKDSSAMAMLRCFCLFKWKTISLSTTIV